VIEPAEDGQEFAREPVVGLEAPPADPEQWTDEQWLSWLEATDDDEGTEKSAPPVTRGARLARSTGGSVLGAAMLGLGNAFYGPRDDDVVTVQEANGDTEDDDPVSVYLDHDHPERSYAVLRQAKAPPA
jgi:hypothetical protein